MLKKLQGLVFMLVGGLTLFACGTTRNVAVVILTGPEEVYLNVMSTSAIEVSVLPSDASNKDLTYAVNLPEIATVDSNGLLTGVSLGEAALTVTSIANPSVRLTVNIFVVEKVWPSVEITSFAGFDLPLFPDFTSVIVSEEEHSLTLAVKGTTPSNVNSALSEYKDLLLSDGWEVENYDNHYGELVHADHGYELLMHNDFVHAGGDTIMFTLSEEGVYHDHDHDH